MLHSALQPCSPRNMPGMVEMKHAGPTRAPTRRRRRRGVGGGGEAQQQQVGEES